MLEIKFSVNKIARIKSGLVSRSQPLTPAGKGSGIHGVVPLQRASAGDYYIAGKIGGELGQASLFQEVDGGGEFFFFINLIVLVGVALLI